MSDIKRRNNSSVPEFQAPINHIFTEKAKIIKQLTEKQLNTHICLKEELIKEKHFTKSNDFISITTYTKGENNLESYKEFAKLFNNREELKSYGLTEHEIDFLNEYKNGEDYILLKHKNLCREALELKLKYIFDLIEQAKNTETNVQQIPCNHPINNLQQLNDELFGHLNKKQIVPSLKKRRKRIKKYLDIVDNESEINIDYAKKKTKWDIKDIDAYHSKNKSIYVNTKILDTNFKQNDYGIKNKVSSGGKPFIGWKTEKEDTKIINDSNKITIEEIRLIPRFKNYNVGTPSKVLFIKNLAKSTTEEDLVNVFGRFDNGTKRITYRLLSGKMKGQAFITFNDVDQATNALKTINGYIINSKPIIIEYGKSKFVSP